MNILKFLCIFLAISMFVKVTHQECIHDQLDIKLEEFPDEEVDPEGHAEGRMLAASTWGPLRIRADFSHFRGSAATKAYIKNKLLPPIFKYFSSTLQVKRLSKLKLSSAVCGLGVPSVYRSTGVNADIVFFITGERAAASWIAWAKPCSTLASTGRAFAGQININLNDIVASNDVEFEKDMMTVMHEMTHVLGISQTLFPKYLHKVKQGYVTANGIRTPYISVSPLTEKVRSHFGCPSAIGALLENQGGSGSAGSHFERRVFMNEYMTASATTDMRITKFSLALLESSGWYKVNYKMADNFNWGAGKGCSFITGHCSASKWAEFCSHMGQAGCNYHRTHGAYCGNTGGSYVLDNFVDNCPYYAAYANADCSDPKDRGRATIAGEFYGDGSKCFMGTLYNGGALRAKRAYCLKYQCQKQSSGKYHVKMIVGSHSGICKAKGSIRISGYSGTLDCPDPSSFCKGVGKRFCKRGCMGRGKCLASGKCQCHAGFSGRGCMKGGAGSAIQQEENVYAPDFDPATEVVFDKDYINQEDDQYLDQDDDQYVDDQYVDDQYDDNQYDDDQYDDQENDQNENQEDDQNEDQENNEDN